MPFLGLSAQGIFRRSGSATVISGLQAQFEANDNAFDVDISHAPIHSLTSLFKRFLHQLPPRYPTCLPAQLPSILW